MRKVEDPVVTQEGTPTADYRATHPAFGQVIVSRRSTGGFSNFLYGTDHHHAYTYSLTIHTSELVRHLSGDRYHSDKLLIEIELSEDQFNGITSRVGSGEGTPCTLRWTPAAGMIPELPRPGRRVDQFRKELEGVVVEAEQGIQEALAEIDALPISQKKKDSLRGRLGGVTERIIGSATFVAGRFEEHVAEVTEAAKSTLAANTTRYNPPQVVEGRETVEDPPALPRPPARRVPARRQK